MECFMRFELYSHRHERGYCVIQHISIFEKVENTKLKSVNYSPFTSEMFVKREQGILINVMPNFYFLMSVKRA